jgi:hypothetical protein
MRGLVGNLLMHPKWQMHLLCGISMTTAGGMSSCVIYSKRAFTNNKCALGKKKVNCLCHTA